MADPATGLTPPLAPRAHAYSENAKRTQPSVGVKYYVVVWTKCPVFNGLAQELLCCVPNGPKVSEKAPRDTLSQKPKEGKVCSCRLTGAEEIV